MADVLNDASTDIEKVCGTFVKDMNKIYADIHKKKNKDSGGGKNKKGFPLLTFFIGKGDKVGFRTPLKQAKLITQLDKSETEKTSVCWSAHMSDKARHVPVRINGVVAKKNELAKVLGKEDYAVFTSNWVKIMKKNGLLNYDRKAAFPKTDTAHLELPDARVKKSSTRAQACMVAYVKIVEKDPQRKNSKFEANCKAMLEKIRKKLAEKKK